MISDTMLFANRRLAFGEFVCRHDDPTKGRTGIARAFLVVIPKVSGQLLMGGRPVSGSMNMSVLYNVNTEYVCRAVVGGVERVHYIAMPRETAGEVFGEFDPAASGEHEHVFSRPRCYIPPGAFFQQEAVACHARGDRCDPLLMEEALYCALRLLAASAASVAGSRAGPSRLTARQHEYARWTEEHLGRTFSERHSVHDVSSRIGVSAYHLCRVFRDSTGKSMHAYRLELRLRHAAMLIAESRLELNAIAADCGFASQSHLTNAFRTFFGITPARARGEFRSGKLRPDRLSHAENALLALSRRKKLGDSPGALP